MIFYYKIASLIELVRNFFGKGHDRSINVKRNILASFLIRFSSILISLILVPLTIDYVNTEQYGIWLTLSSIIGWLGYFDIGFGNGLRNKFAESVALGDQKLAKVYVSTTYAALGMIIVFLVLIFISVNPVLNWSHILNAPETMKPALNRLALIVIVLFCFQLLFQLLGTVLTANQQPAISSSFNLIANFISLIIIYLLTKSTNGNLTYLGLALCIPPVIVLLLSSIWFYNHKYKAYSPSFSYVDLRRIKSLMGLGIKFFILQIATLVLYQTSNIIIAHLFGNENVTIYNIAYKYFNIVTMLMLIIMMPLWSAFTDAWTRKEMTWITNTMKKLNYLWLVLSVGVIIMLLFSDLVYRLWVGKEIHIPFIISLVFAVSIIINSGAYIYSIFLNGVGIIKIQLILAIFGSLLFIPLAIGLAKIFGLSGVVVAATLVNSLNLIFFIIQYKKIITLSAKGIWAK